ncbi:MAG: hypothetical protein P8Z39_04910, partial [Gammaproteobacteria bacterium]
MFSRIPNGSYVDRNGREPRRRGPLFPLVIILVLAAGFYLYEAPEQSWASYMERLQILLGAEETKDDPVAAEKSDAAPEESAAELHDQPDLVESAPIAAEKQPSDQIKITPLQLDVSIGLGFRPVGFKIAAVSQTIPLSRKPGGQLRHLPTLASTQPWYGVINLAHGSEYGFVLDLAAGGSRMFIDLNRNGDLRDDGEPLVNQGDGAFAHQLALPLAKVTGIPKLTGVYRLWIFTDPASLEKGKIRYYSMTQLQGVLLLKGRRYTAFLADNGPVDGDYRNDGISIDLDGDGKIER